MLIKLFSLSAFGLVISLPAAFATPLSPNSGSSTVAIGGSGFTGVLVADTGVLNFNTTKYVGGTLEQKVYKEASGSLDFYYLVTNNSTSLDSLSRLTSNDFTGFTTDVSYMSTGGIAPTSVNRSTVGDTVGFFFVDQNQNNTLAPNHSSDWLEISTNATQFTSGTSNVLDGSPAMVQTYAPTAAPEPMSMSLLGAGLAGFGLLGLRRRSAKK